MFDVAFPDKPLTRKSLLSAMSSLFDPLGLVAPCTLAPKLLLQELCKRCRRWDERLEEAEIRTWNDRLSDLAELHKLPIMRCIKPSNLGPL